MILDAALTRFAIDGFDRATTAAICREARISSGTFIHYFPTTGNTLLAVQVEGFPMASVSRSTNHISGLFRPRPICFNGKARAANNAQVVAPPFGPPPRAGTDIWESSASRQHFEKAQ